MSRHPTAPVYILEARTSFLALSVGKQTGKGDN